MTNGGYANFINTGDSVANGNSLILMCDAGYGIADAAGNSLGGVSKSVTCVAGDACPFTAMDHDYQCLPASCAAPSTPTETVANVGMSDEFFNGQGVSFDCDTSDYCVGTKTQTCMIFIGIHGIKEGIYSESGSCEAHYCLVPAVPTNGAISVNGVAVAEGDKFQSTENIDFSCDFGFDLVNSNVDVDSGSISCSTTMCQTPITHNYECVTGSCPAPPTDSGVSGAETITVTNTEFPDQSVISYPCNSNTHCGINTVTNTCNVNSLGLLEGNYTTSGTCTLKSCTLGAAITSGSWDNGAVEGDALANQGVQTMSCSTGMHLKDSSGNAVAGTASVTCSPSSTDSCVTEISNPGYTCAVGSCPAPSAAVLASIAGVDTSSAITDREYRVVFLKFRILW